MRKWTLIRGFSLLLFLLLPLSFGGCEISCDTNQGPVEEAADEVEDAAEEAGDAIEDAGDG